MKAFLFSGFLVLFFLGCDQIPKEKKTSHEIKSNSVIVELKQIWTTDSLQLKTPECATYGSNQNVFYVSNLNRDNEIEGDGFISIVNVDGSIKDARWIEGLTSPLGSELYNGFLYVNDKTNILKINIENGEIIDKIIIEGAIGLNGMDIDKKGNIYVADSGGNKIYKITQEKEIFTLYEGEDLNRPNGLFLKNEKELLVASSGGNSLESLNLENKKIITLVEGIGQADGIIQLAGGHYLTSSWTGEVYFISNKLEKQKILDTKNQKINAADIGYIPQENILVVPTFYDNRLIAYKIKLKKE